MAGRTPRASTHTAGSGEDGRNTDQKRNLWTSMLESVASGKRLPEKNLIVLGGSPETQREFIESLSSSEGRQTHDRQPPVANSFALGYTYYDVLDADQDDTLARVSLYFLAQPSAELSPLISPLLKPETIPNTALVILLDWSHPHQWLRQIWKWIRLLENVMGQVDADARTEMESVMASWRERGRGGSSVNLDGTPTAAGASGEVDGLLPLGPGEWSEPLGLPLCVVCQNAQKMEFLEKNKGWKEPDFDTVLQYLRTVLLRHGASLIYTSQNTPSQLPLLIHSTLGITSLLKRQPPKNNVIDRDKIVVAPNWDSWGKIRILGGTFDAETVSSGWEADIQQQEPAHAVSRYEEWCRDPNSGGLALIESLMNDGTAVSVESEDPQAFLEKQLSNLEALKAKAQATKSGAAPTASFIQADYAEEKSVNDHIGPVQFNMGGIQVDADDMLQRLKDRNARVSPEDDYEQQEDNGSMGNMVKDFDNEQLQSFFSGLMNRTAGTAENKS